MFFHMKDKNAVVKHLNDILELELAGVVRYLHYSLMARGPGRIPVVKFFQEQAMESFEHAAKIGEKITALGAHPSLSVKSVPDTKTHATIELLKESMSFEKEAIEMYKKLIPLVEGDIPLEELAREMVRMETEHVEEVAKMVEQT
jgi:bacterioferritin